MAQMETKPVEVPKTEFYIGYAFLHADTAGSNVVSSTNMNGFAFEFSHYMHSHNLGFTIDLARTSNSKVDSTGIKYLRTSYMAGPTYRIHNIGFFTANVHALAGIDRDDFTVPQTSNTIDYRNTDLAAAIGVSVDGNLSRHLALRVAQVDYIYTNHNSTNQGSFRYTGGVVARF
jgi:hypothetical protein